MSGGAQALSQGALPAGPAVGDVERGASAVLVPLTRSGVETAVRWVFPTSPLITESSILVVWLLGADWEAPHRGWWQQRLQKPIGGFVHAAAGCS